MSDEGDVVDTGRVLTCDPTQDESLEILLSRAHALSEGCGVLLVRLPKNNRWMEGQEPADACAVKWLAALVGDSDYLCFGEYFIDSRLEHLVYGATPEEATERLLGLLTPPSSRPSETEKST